MSAVVLPFPRKRRRRTAAAFGTPAAPASPAPPTQVPHDSIVKALAELAGPISCPSCEAFLPWIVNGQCQQCLAIVSTDRSLPVDRDDRTDKY
jgi:hypothetical protein